jgi:hypothetical protein
MRDLAHTLRRACWTVCACVLLVLLLPHSAAAGPSLAIDLDGDGRRDQVTLDRLDPSLLHVWLSASSTTQVIRSHVPLLQVAAADLDGDHRPELIARDGNSKLHVWMRKHTRFHWYRPRDGARPLLEQPNRRSLEDNDSEPPGVLTSAPFTPIALTLCASPRAPGLEASIRRAPHTARACRPVAVVDPFAPRPPPPSLSL